MPERRAQRVPLNALFAGLAIPQQETTRTHQTKIAERLDDGHALPAQCVICGRRNERKGIVEMRDFGRVSFGGSSQAAVGGLVPHGGQPGGEAVGDARIAVGVGGNPMSATFKERSLGGEDSVFSAGLLVAIVNAKYGLQRRS